MILSTNNNNTNTKIFSNNFSNNKLLCEENLLSNNIVSADEDNWSAFNIDNNILCNDYNKIDKKANLQSNNFLCNRRISNNSIVNTQTLDYFTGTNFKKPKKENTELFSIKQQKKTNLIYNIDNNRLNISNRQNNNSNTEQIQVGPGVGLNYLEISKHGKNNGLMYRPAIRTIDDIRVQSKLQKSYTVPTIKGNDYIKGSIIGKVSRNKPDQFKINTFDDLVKRGGLRKDRNRTSKIDMKKTHKENHIEYFGSHNGNQHQYNQGKVNNPKKNALPGHNNNVMNSTYTSKYVYDPNNIARDTIKQTTIYPANNQHINPITRQGYTNDPNNLARDTIKQSTIYPINNHHINSNVKEGYTNDPNNLARDTIKQTTIYSANNHQINSNVKEGYTNDPNNLAKETIKETTINNNHLGGINQKDKTYTFDPTDIPATTLKEIISNCYHIGITNGTIRSTYTFNPDDIPAPTLKEIYLNTFYLGNANKSNNDAYKILDPEVRQTLRSIHSIFYTSIIKGPQKQKDYSSKVCINDNKNDIESRLNKIIKLVKGSFPRTTNQNQIGAYNAKHGKHNIRSGNIHINNLNPLNKSNIGEYSSKTVQTINRIDPDNLKKQLCSNPYVNNLMFKFNC